MFLLAKIPQEAGPGVHCTESRCVDCEEIEAYPVPRACAGDHTPSPCWGFVLDGDSERCVPKNCTETRLGGLELARAGVGSCLTSPAWPRPRCLAWDRMVRQLCLRNTGSAA